MTSIKPLKIWMIGVFFLLFQFFLQLSSGVILTALDHEIELSSFAIGILASAFYYVYSAMQLPVGILFDRYNARYLLALTAFFCGLGCFVFAYSHSFAGLFLGRFLMGAGSSFAFIGLSHLTRIYFPLQQFSFYMGLSETMGFTITIISIISMSALIHEWGWRGFIFGTSGLGILISFLCWYFIPNEKPTEKSNLSFKIQILTVIKNKKAWINGLYVGLIFSIVTVFGALWAVPFTQLKINCNLHEATVITCFLLLGAGMSCLLFGKLAVIYDKRKPLMHLSCYSTGILLLIILFVPMTSSILLGILMFLTGLCCGSYLLSYTIATELTEPESRSTFIGFTNTLAMITAPLLQPLIGYILDVASLDGYPSLSDYQMALLVIPLAVFIADFLIFFLPEKQVS